ncbi:MAG: putative signal transducing protein [Alphaproteobacteria bacterium]
MGMICRGTNLPYLMEVQSVLEEHGIPVLVQDAARYFGGYRILTVPDADHDRAMTLLRDAGLDPAQNDLTSGA